MMKLMLGGGSKDYPGYTNHDMVVDGVDIRYLPEGGETVDVIECHHALEHISWREIEQTFRGWHHVLKPGGRLILTFPDAAAVMRGYLDEYNPVRKLTHWGQILAGSQNAPFTTHMSVLDEDVVMHYLELAGFALSISYNVSDDHNGPGMHMEAIRK